MPDPVPMQPASANGEMTATGSLRARIESAIGNLFVLRVTTVTGTVTATAADQLNRVTGLTLAPEGQQVASTSFNMLLGDGCVVMSPAFVSDPAMRELHADAVNQAQAIRERSAALLKSLWETFADVLDPGGQAPPS